MRRDAIALLLASAVIIAPALAGRKEKSKPKTAKTSAQPATVSVRAGFLNHAEGEVRIDGRAVDLASGRLYEVAAGKRLQTGNGRAELTLSIGGFIRIGPESEVEMIQPGIQAATLRLHRGEVVVDIPFLVERQVSSVWAGGGEVRFEKPGMYRVAVGDSGAFAIQVFDGRATRIAAAETTGIKKGKALSVDPSGSLEMGLAAAARGEPLLAWSKERRKLWRRQELRAGRNPYSMSLVDRELLHLQTNRPLPTVIVQ